MNNWKIDPDHPTRIVAPCIGGHSLVAECVTAGTAMVLLHRMQNWIELEEAVKYGEKCFQKVQNERREAHEHQNPLDDPMGLIIEEARRKCTKARFAADGILP